MKQRLHDVLAVKFTCAANAVAIGQQVRISADNTVAALNGAGQLTLVGTVCAYTAGDLFCTVETRFRERRDDRKAGAQIAVGPFVWDAAGKAIAYNAALHDPNAIAGLCIKAGAQLDSVIETLEL